jgi:uncharacterized protein YndB with AHSA1/START domain
MNSYDLTVHSAAPPATVFDVLADTPRWKEWGGATVSTSEWEREGDPAPGGVGAVRRVGRWPLFGREQILECEPPSHMAYTVLSGVPVRDYHADIDLTADSADTGTVIHWRATFEPRIPGTGAFFAAMFHRLIGDYARRAAAEAERRARSA